MDTTPTSMMTPPSAPPPAVPPAPTPENNNGGSRKRLLLIAGLIVVILVSVAAYFLDIGGLFKGSWNSYGAGEAIVGKNSVDSALTPNAPSLIKSDSGKWRLSWTYPGSTPVSEFKKTGDKSPTYIFSWEIVTPSGTTIWGGQDAFANKTIKLDGLADKTQQQGGIETDDCYVDIYRPVLENFVLKDEMQIFDGKQWTCTYVNIPDNILTELFAQMNYGKTFQFRVWMSTGLWKNEKIAVSNAGVSDWVAGPERKPPEISGLKVTSLDGDKKPTGFEWGFNAADKYPSAKNSYVKSGNDYSFTYKWEILDIGDKEVWSDTKVPDKKDACWKKLTFDTNNAGSITSTVDQSTFLQWTCPKISIPQAVRDNLAPGDYTFNIVLTNGIHSNTYHQQKATLKFTIPKPAKYDKIPGLDLSGAYGKADYKPLTPKDFVSQLSLDKPSGLPEIDPSMSDADFNKYAKTWLSWKAITPGYDSTINDYNLSVFDHSAQKKSDESGAAFAYRWEIFSKLSSSTPVFNKEFFGDIAGADTKCNKKLFMNYQMSQSYADENNNGDINVAGKETAEKLWTCPYLPLTKELLSKLTIGQIYTAKVVAWNGYQESDPGTFEFQTTPIDYAAIIGAMPKAPDITAALAALEAKKKADEEAAAKAAAVADPPGVENIEATKTKFGYQFSWKSRGVASGENSILKKGDEHVFNYKWTLRQDGGRDDDPPIWQTEWKDNADANFEVLDRKKCLDKPVTDSTDGSNIEKIWTCEGVALTSKKILKNIQPGKFGYTLEIYQGNGKYDVKSTFTFGKKAAEVAANSDDGVADAAKTALNQQKAKAAQEAEAADKAAAAKLKADADAKAAADKAAAEAEAAGVKLVAVSPASVVSGSVNVAFTLNPTQVGTAIVLKGAGTITDTISFEPVITGVTPTAELSFTIAKVPDVTTATPYKVNIHKSGKPYAQGTLLVNPIAKEEATTDGTVAVKNLVVKDIAGGYVVVTYDLEVPGALSAKALTSSLSVAGTKDTFVFVDPVVAGKKSYGYEAVLFAHDIKDASDVVISVSDGTKILATSGAMKYVATLNKTGTLVADKCAAGQTGVWPACVTPVTGTVGGTPGNVTNITNITNITNPVGPTVSGGSSGGGNFGGSSGGSSGGSAQLPAAKKEEKLFKFNFKTTPLAKHKDLKSNPMLSQITILVNAGVVSGYNPSFYGPNDTLTRAQFLKMVVNAFQLTSKTTAVTANPCKDVTKRAWYATYFATAKELGIVKGYTDGTCKPDQPVTRSEATKILFHAIASIQGKTATIVVASVGTNDVNPFKDVNPKDDLYKYILSAQKYGFMSGYGKQLFGPKINLTRAQAAKIIVNSLNKLAVK